MMLRILLSAGLLIVGACSSDPDKQNDLLRPGGASASAGTGAASGVAGSPVNPGGVAGTGSASAGRGSAGSIAAGTGAAGVSAAAGAPAGAAGSAGQTSAGVGAAGMSAGPAGSGAVGAAGAGMAGAMAAAGSGGSTAGSVTVEFTTVSYDGEYAPLNYGAVWFEDASKKFIKTAKRWAGAAHATDLVGWTAASGGWGSVFGGGGNMADMMDAMSSATVRTHQKHTVMWNMMNAMKQLVPDGDYVAVVEMTESRARDRAGPVLRIPFKKGPTPQSVEVPDGASFTGVVLRYTP
jgi:hypothetical protein